MSEIIRLDVRKTESPASSATEVEAWRFAPQRERLRPRPNHAHVSRINHAHVSLLHHCLASSETGLLCVSQQSLETPAG